MKNAEAGTDARKWGDAIKVIRPTFANAKSGGTHVSQRRGRGRACAQQGQRH